MNQLASAPLPESRLQRVFERWWPDLEGNLTKIEVRPSNQEKVRDDRALLEEVVNTIRTGSGVGQSESYARYSPAHFKRAASDTAELVLNQLNRRDLDRLRSELALAYSQGGDPIEQGFREQFLRQVHRRISSDETKKDA